MSGGRHDGRDGERDDLSGFGLVNEAPEGQAAEDRAVGSGAADGSLDEVALRRLFQGAVSGLEPSTDALDHLRRAVPARRARKRQAVVGMAAAIVLVGTAVPALVHVASSDGISTDKAVNAGHGEQAQGGTGTETGIEGGQKTTTPSPGATATGQGGAEGTTGRPPAATAPGTGVGSGAKPTPSVAPDAPPACLAGQLGVVSAQAGAPDESGKVYGTFRIANVSPRDCVVGGAGKIAFEAHGAADRTKIAVVEHTAGDAAGGLPDPAQESPRLLLTPDNAYEVKFAWVPSETCPTTGTTPTPTPTDPTSGGSTTGGTTTGGSGAEPSANTPDTQTTDGTTADGSIAVTHTADPGGPVAETTVPNACAGTIYRTGILDAS